MTGSTNGRTSEPGNGPLKGIVLLALMLIGSLFALTGLRQFFVEPLANPLPNTLWFVLQVAPLLVVLPGVLRGSGRGFFYAMLAAMLYFIHGVMQAATPGLRTLALWEVGFSVALIATGWVAMKRTGAPPSRGE
ncbi:MAG: DUF2069 domain-containing protein [Pseudomonadales bacterium]|nr:DUF2069 domain-containing protein [Pseudomonadales bacterium]